MKVSCSPCNTCQAHRPIFRTRTAIITRAAKQEQSPPPATTPTIPRRSALLAGVVILCSTQVGQLPAFADDFSTTASGLKYFDVKVGEGKSPKPGDTVVVHWAGYTKGYQGKRIDNTSVRDEPYEFVLGAGEAIPAFEEAVSSMKAGGLRRIEVPGERPALAFSRDRSQRFTSELFRDRIFKYRVGPQPAELGGQRALDFVLDNETLQDFNRTLLFDIKVLSVRPARK